MVPGDSQPAFAQLCDALGDGVLLTDGRARIVYVNEVFSSILGAEADRLAGSASTAVIRFAFGLDDDRWQHLRNGQPILVACHPGEPQELELVRVDFGNEGASVGRIAYILRGVGREVESRLGARPSVFLDPEDMVRAMYEAVARCWSDRRPMSLLGLLGVQADSSEAQLFARVIAEHAGSEARVGALPERMLGPVTADEQKNRLEGWVWATVPGCPAQGLDLLRTRISAELAAEGLGAAQLRGASLDDIAAAPLPRVESWVLSLLRAAIGARESEVQSQRWGPRSIGVA